MTNAMKSFSLGINKHFYFIKSSSQWVILKSVVFDFIFNTTESSLVEEKYGHY